MNIFIDAGHMGSPHDPGAVNGGRHEADDNLRLARAVEPLFRARGCRTRMARDGNVNLSVGQRIRDANGWRADFYLSLHRNAFADPQANGVETFVFTDADIISVNAANAVQRNIMAAGAQCDLGVKRDRGTKSAGFAVLRDTAMPAVLHELGFISNARDNLLFDSKLNLYAQAIVDGVCEALGVPSGARHELTPGESDLLYRIAWAEARGEDDKGLILVANVILNRVNSPQFPGTVREVIFQPGQFTPVTNGALERAAPDGRIRDAVNRALGGEDYSQGALFFRAVRGAEGSWHESALRRLFVHGGHIFYTVREQASQQHTGGAARQTAAPGGTAGAFRFGDTVRIRQEAAVYATGQAIPGWVKQRGHTVMQVKADRVLLREIYSWVFARDLFRE